MSLYILRLPAVQTVLGCSRSAFYQRIKEGLITKQVRLGPRSVGWPSHEIDALVTALIAGKTDDEIRQLVTELEAKRKTMVGGLV